jgi:hypothetical protein
VRTRNLRRLGATAAALVATLGSSEGAGAQARPAAPSPLPDQPLPPGAPGLPQLPPDSAGAAAIASAISAPRRAIVVDAGPGMGGRILRAALGGRHLLVDARDSGLVVGRAVSIDRPLIVIGDTRVAGTIRGDLVVLGDLYLRPGALIEGRAIAIGGRVAPSALARVGDMLSFADLTFAARDGADGAIELRLAPREGVVVSRVALPGVAGFRLPSYSRIDGLALTFGPEIRLDTGRVRIEPLVTYRSHLGVVDPGLVATAELTRRTAVELRASRGTFTNDAWIRGDIINSALALGVGTDARNYYRADRAEATVGRRFETTRHVLEPFVGGLVERSWSAARDTLSQSRPYAVLNRDDALEGMRRLNPAVTGGRITSALFGARWQVETESRIRGGATLRVEQALAVGRAARFTQGTLDGALQTPGFSDHVVQLLAHAVGTVGPDTPTQRYAYLGGSGTIPSLLLLEQGGSELLWLESRYTVPVHGIRLPLAGTPAVTLRHIVGGAGLDRLPSLTQNIGIRLNVSVVRVDYVFDPTGRGRNNFSVGVGLR